MESGQKGEEIGQHERYPTGDQFKSKGEPFFFFFVSLLPHQRFPTFPLAFHIIPSQFLVSL